MSSLLKWLYVAWTVCVLTTLSHTELEATIQRVLNRVETEGVKLKSALVGALWLCLLTPAFCLRFTFHGLNVVFRAVLACAINYKDDTTNSNGQSGPASETASENRKSGAEAVTD